MWDQRSSREEAPWGIGTGLKFFTRQVLCLFSLLVLVTELGLHKKTLYKVFSFPQTSCPSYTFKLNISKKHTIPSQSIKEITSLKSWARIDGVSKSLPSWPLITITHSGRQWVRITFDWVRFWHIRFTKRNCGFWEGNREAGWLGKDVKRMARWRHQRLKPFG